jgi:DNA-binding CsgD family transcriptional regulator
MARGTKEVILDNSETLQTIGAEHVVTESGIAISALRHHSLPEINPSQTIPDVETLHEWKNKNAYLAPAYIQELKYISLGFSAKESADLQGIGKEGVRTRRKRVNEFFDSRTSIESIAKAIQHGYMPIEVEEYPINNQLSPVQENILRLRALGWTLGEITKKCSISHNTVNSHYQIICQKLEARSIAHSIRRAFELGIFKVGEQILDPTQALEKRSNGLQLSISGEVFKPHEIGITHGRQLEILSLLTKLQAGSFKRVDIYGLGFYADAENDGAKAHAFGRAMNGLIRKLNQTTDGPVLEQFGVKGSRRYEFRKTIGVETLDQMNIIHAVPATEKPSLGPQSTPNSLARRRAKQKKIGSSILPKRLVETVPLPSNPKQTDLLQRDELVEIDEDFLAKLRARDPSEVLENENIKKAVSSIVKQGMQIDYRPRVLIPLRYGVAPNFRLSPLSINRAGEYVKLEHIMQYVPAYQGLGVESVSQIIGITPLSVLSVEKKFINEHQRTYPELKTLMQSIDEQIEELESVAA